MPKLAFLGDGEALPIATITSLAELLKAGDGSGAVAFVVSELEPKHIGAAAGSMRWRDRLVSFNKKGK